MKTSPTFKTNPLFLIILALGFLALSPRARAVNPPPDGGYAGFNTAEGTNALQHLTTGVANAALGWYSLFNNTEGAYNTALGAGTLLFNVGDQSTGEGIQNTAIGAAALLFNATGHENTAVGAFSLFTNTIGEANTATGWQALLSNTIGFRNTASGAGALYGNTEGSFNTASGFSALYSNTIGGANTATGAVALNRNTTGVRNTASGFNALASNITGGINTANGSEALYLNTIGNENTGSGGDALYSNISGSGNTAIGVEALRSNTTGSYNTVIGHQACLNNTTGSYNIVLVGGANLTTGDFNIDIGNNGEAGDTNTIRIGNPLHNRAFIAGISGVTASGGTAVYIDSNGQLGTATSSARFKDEIRPMDKDSEAILALRPVSFRYKKDIDPQRIPQFGLLAEEVEKINPDLIIRDREGKPQTVRYEQINAMLLNEFLKEHEKIEQQQATIAKQQKQIDALTSGLQKVSARIEAANAAPQIVANRP